MSDPIASPLEADPIPNPPAGDPNSAQDLARGLRGSGKQHPKTIDDAALADVQRFVREIGEPRAANEIDDGAGHGHLITHRTRRIDARRPVRHVGVRHVGVRLGVRHRPAAP